jgi:peptide/nickel transport system substrate-binding protein/oligopeptide transport system substrate-binding protein
MKKLISVILCIIIIFTVCSCASDNANTPKSVEEYVSKNFIDPINEWQKYDALINEINSTYDFKKRAELLHQAEDILMATACILPIYYCTDTYLQKNQLHNIYSNPFGHKYFNHALLSNGDSTVIINLQSEPYTLDPAFDSSMHGATIAVNSFAGLYTYDENGNAIPDLAVGYTVTEPQDDGSVTYTVRLHNDLKWSDGSKLTANDFVYSWKRTATSTADYSELFSAFSGYPNNLSVCALDDTTLQFSLTAPCAYIESLLSLPTFFPVKQSEVERFSDEHAWCLSSGFVSNGPFRCLSNNSEKNIVYEKNPYYHRAHELRADKIKFQFGYEDSGIYNSFVNNNIHFVNSVSPNIIHSHRDPSEIHSVPLLSTNYIAFNTQSSIFKAFSPKEAACIRLAINTLIDRAYLSGNIKFKNQIPANSLIPIGMKDGNGGVFKTDITHNAYFNENFITQSRYKAIEEAKNMLIAAGLSFDDTGMISTDNPISFNLLINNGSSDYAIAEAIKSDLEVVGIKVFIEVANWSDYLLKRKNGEYDIIYGGFSATFNDPISLLSEFTTTSISNHCRFGQSS